MKKSADGIAMNYPTAASARDRRAFSVGRIACQAVLALWIYSVACAAVAVGLGEGAATVADGDLPDAWVRWGTIACVVVAAGLNAHRVLIRVENRLTAPRKSK